MDLDQCRKIIELLRQASQPIVIAGSGTWYSEAGKESDLPLWKRPGYRPSPPLSAGGLSRTPIPYVLNLPWPFAPVQPLFANMSADLVLFLGARMSLFYIFGDLFNKEAKIIQVDIEAEEIGRNRSVDLPVVRDIQALLSLCNRLIEEKNLALGFQKRFEDWVSSLKKAEEDGKAEAKAQWESTEYPDPPLRLTAEINNFMDREDDIVVADGGDTQIWMGMTRTVRQSGHYLDSGLYGCLGVGIPYANAAQYPASTKTGLFDHRRRLGGFNFMEFETAIRKNLPIVAVISNDLGWGMIRHSQELKIGHAIQDGTYIGRVNYHKMVEALGGKGMLVEKPEDIRPALEEAFESGMTTCINVMTDPTTISPGSVALANLGGYKA